MCGKLPFQASDAEHKHPLHACMHAWVRGHALAAWVLLWQAWHGGHALLQSLQGGWVAAALPGGKDIGTVAWANDELPPSALWRSALLSQSSYACAAGTHEVFDGGVDLRGIAYV